MWHDKRLCVPLNISSHFSGPEKSVGEKLNAVTHWPIKNDTGNGQIRSNQNIHTTIRKRFSSADKRGHRFFRNSRSLTLKIFPEGLIRHRIKNRIKMIGASEL